MYIKFKICTLLLLLLSRFSHVRLRARRKQPANKHREANVSKKTDFKTVALSRCFLNPELVCCYLRPILCSDTLAT